MAEERKFSDGSISRGAFVALLRDDLTKNVAEIEGRSRPTPGRLATLRDRIYSATRSLVRLGEAVSDDEMRHAQKAAPGTATPNEVQRALVEGLPVFTPARERRSRPRFQADNGAFSELY